MLDRVVFKVIIKIHGFKLLKCISTRPYGLYIPSEEDALSYRREGFIASA